MKIRLLFLIFNLFLTCTLSAQESQDTLTVQGFQDTVYTFSGDTLLGKVFLNKEKNIFFFANDSLKEQVLLEKDIESFVMYNEESDDEAKQFFNVLNSFYELKSAKNTRIVIYVKATYKMLEEYGQKYFTAQKEYCVFKNGVPYFINKNNQKQTISFLIKDCPAIYNKYKNQFYNVDDVFPVLHDYNTWVSTPK